MIQHIVLLQPRPDSTPETLETARQAILALPGQIDGIESVAWGPNVSPEGLAQGYTVGFSMTFTDASARDAYLPHPAHLAVGPAMRAVAERTLVFDLAL